MVTFTLFWLEGKKEVLQGTDLMDAIHNAGYSTGILYNLDWWERGNTLNNKHVWIPEEGWLQ